MEQTTIRNYINGQWVDEAGVNYVELDNPSTGEVIGKVPFCTEKTANDAIAAAKEAFESWRKVPVAARTAYLFKLYDLIQENYDDLAFTISYEQGKSPVDAHAEMVRVVENIQSACAAPLVIQGDFLENAAPNIHGEVIPQPLGVCGLVVPYNFPAMVPFWFFPYALAAGNTIVVKASEQVPITMQKIFRLLDQIGLPKGVANLINGDAKVAKAILDSPDVKAVSFVGSTAVAKIIASSCANTGKRFQALGGAKNYFVVMEDAKMDQVVKSFTTSCYGCAGQRCMAASIVAAVPAVYEDLKSRLVAAAQTLKVGDATDPTVGVGPVISAAHKEKVLNYIETGIKEGAKLLLDGRNPELPEKNQKGYFIGPTIFADVTPEMTIAQEEIFGPVVCLMKIENLDQAIKQIKEHQYGNGASVFTQNGHYAHKFMQEADAGMVGINVGIPAPVAQLPFGGVKNSAYTDIKAQGRDVFSFFTTRKIVTTRFFPED